MVTVIICKMVENYFVENLHNTRTPVSVRVASDILYTSPTSMKKIYNKEIVRKDKLVILYNSYTKSLDLSRFKCSCVRKMNY